MKKPYQNLTIKKAGNSELLIFLNRMKSRLRVKHEKSWKDNVFWS
jgi:hypothetical protein